MDLLESMAMWMQLSLLLGIVLAGALCFALDASSELPTVVGAPAQSARASEWVLLTILEQGACKALCVDRRLTDA